MKIEYIERAINELELADTSVSNVSELASLYVVRDHLKNAVQTKLDGSDAKLRKELADILPSYETYCEQKRLFQMRRISEDAVIPFINDVCREIREFIETLYRSTDCQKERLIIIKMLSDINIEK